MKKKAFTLVELLIVIAILAILSTVGIIGYSSLTKKAESSVYEQERTQQMIADLAEQVENQDLLTWEDVENQVLEAVAKAASGTSDSSKSSTSKSQGDYTYVNTPAGNVTVTTQGGNVDYTAIKAIIDSALNSASKSQLTEEQVKKIIENALGNIEFATKEDLEAIETVYDQYGVIAQMNQLVNSKARNGATITTPYDAAKLVALGGYDLGSLKLTSNSKSWIGVAFDIADKQFELVTNETEADSDLFVLVNDATDFYKTEDKFSAYLQDGYAVAANSDKKQIFETSMGVDLGTNAFIDGITLTRETAASKALLVRTAGNKTDFVLEINAPNDTVNHYGFANTINVIAVANASYHEYGSCGSLVATSGRIVIEDSGFVVNLSKSGTENTEFDVKGTVITAEAGTKSQEEVKTDKVYINNLAQLESFRDASNSGNNFAKITIELTCDITLNGPWKPISNYSRNTADEQGLNDCFFAGIFNGNGHTIYGLTNEGIIDSELNTGANNTTPGNKKEVTYGFIACINGATVQNINFENVNIVSFGTRLGDSVAAAVGFVGGNGGTISNINASGSISGVDDGIAGIVGRDYSKVKALIVKNCNNYVNIECSARCAGIIGYSSATGTELNNVHNYGDMTTTKTYTKYQNDGVTINKDYWGVAGIAIAGAGKTSKCDCDANSSSNSGNLYYGNKDITTSANGVMVSGYNNTYAALEN